MASMTGKDLGGLQKCGQYDAQMKAKTTLTGWGKVCKARAEQKKAGRK